MLKKLFLTCSAIGILACSYAEAAVIRVAETDFLAGAGLITFSEFPVNTSNPTYTPTDYGGGPGSPTMTTGGFFLGQSLSATPATDCPGAAATACVVGAPSGPLTLDPSSPATFITTDSAFPTSPTLTGFPRFNGPIALLFDIDLAGVGFDGGFFDAALSTGITAFARDGSLLGTVSNIGTGIEFLGLVTDDGAELIAGVFLDLVGTEPAGFNIDNVRFGLAGQVRIPPNNVPLPPTLPLTMAALFALALVSRSKRAGLTD